MVNSRKKLKNFETCTFRFKDLEPGDKFKFVADIQDNSQITYMKLSHGSDIYTAVDNKGNLVCASLITPEETVVYWGKD